MESTGFSAAVTSVDAARLTQALLDDLATSGQILGALASAMGDLTPAHRRYIGDQYPGLYGVLLDAEAHHERRHHG